MSPGCCNVLQIASNCDGWSTLHLRSVKIQKSTGHISAKFLGPSSSKGNPDIPLKQWRYDLRGREVDFSIILHDGWACLRDFSEQAFSSHICKRMSFSYNYDRFEVKNRGFFSAFPFLSAFVGFGVLKNRFLRGTFYRGGIMVWNTRVWLARYIE